jgi:protein-tyrosine kinase
MRKSVIEKAIGKLSTDGTGRGVQPVRSAADQRRDVSGREAERPVFAEPPMQQRNREGSFHSLGSPGAASEAVISLPRSLLKARGMLVPDSKRTRIAEEYRSIKRPLLMNIDKKGATIVDNANMIMVTSARPGDGKTFTAMNLAISLTMEPDRTVLLIDGDVAKPDAANDAQRRHPAD